MKQTDILKQLATKRKKALAIDAVTLYELTIYNGDLSTTRVFTTPKAAMAAWEETQAEGNYTDAALCELILEGTEFINNSYSLI